MLTLLHIHFIYDEYGHPLWQWLTCTSGQHSFCLSCTFPCTFMPKAFACQFDKVLYIMRIRASAFWNHAS
jgi:hypothetical protein